MIRVSNIKCGLEDGDKALLAKLSKIIKCPVSDIRHMQIIKKALDSRDHSRLHYVCTVDAAVKDENAIKPGKNIVKYEPEPDVPAIVSKTARHRPVVVGSGPAGLFAALVLAEAGLKPIVLERGRAVAQRKQDVDKFWKTGELDEDSNVQFGEGGAGTFSDGKLTTGTKDRRLKRVIGQFIACGAPPEIECLAKPHIGTDKLSAVVTKLRQKIESLGGDVLFEHRFAGFHAKHNALRAVQAVHRGNLLEFETDNLVLGIGHSAHDTFETLYEYGVCMRAKPFAVGVRVEHAQTFINEKQYGKAAPVHLIGAADYKLNAHLPNGRGVYTFCMCPGGFVVAAASEKGRIVTNGMSYHDRDGQNANAAVLVSVSPRDFGERPLDGMAFQRKLEEQAFIAGGGNYAAPMQLLGDFLRNRPSTAFGSVLPTYKPNVKPGDISSCFAGAEYVTESLRAGIVLLDKQMRGFAAEDAVLTGVESRSSSPVTILRDSKSYMCNIAGIFPCGEGAGLAGGIMSAAVDGIKVAEALVESLQ